MSVETQAFKIVFLTNTGTKRSETVVARSSDEAVALLKIPRGRVLSAGPDHLSKFLTTLLRNRPNLYVQANILNLFSRMLASGQPPTQTFDMIVGGYSQFSKRMPEIKNAPKVSEKLRLMEFDSQVVLLAEVGERSGLLAEVLAGAADDMIEKQQIMSEMYKQLIPSAVIAGLSLLVFFVMPIFLIEPINDIKGERGIKMNTNVATDLMLAIGEGLPVYWIHSLVGLALLIGTIKQWWPFAAKIWPFNLIEDFRRISTAYQFVSSFVPLFSRGVPITDALTILQRNGGIGQRRAIARIQTKVSQGAGLAQAFQDPFWHQTLRQAMFGFDQIRDVEKADLLVKIRPLLVQQMKRNVGFINAVFSSFGMILTVSVVLLSFFGMSVPLMSISATR